MNVTEYIANVMPKMEGWCSPEKAAKLAEHAAKAQTFVEIGVFGGRSLFAGALAQPDASVRERVYGYEGYGGWVTYPADMVVYSDGLVGGKSDAIAIGIDPWSAPASVAGFTDANADWWGKLDHDGIYNGCRAMLDRLALNSKCHLLRCTSAQALPLIQRLAPIDLAHVDGNHSEASALFDVENYVPLVKPGGIVFFDDCDWETTKGAQARLGELCEFVEMVGTCGIYYRRK